MGRLSSVPKRIAAVPVRLESINSSSWRGNTKGGATARGYTYQWTLYRKRFLLCNPLCCYCEHLGVTTEASVVDHIIPHQGNQDLFWKPSNHQALCKPCHDSTKAREEKALGYRQ